MPDTFKYRVREAERQIFNDTTYGELAREIIRLLEGEPLGNRKEKYVTLGTDQLLKYIENLKYIEKNNYEVISKYKLGALIACVLEKVGAKYESNVRRSGTRYRALITRKNLDALAGFKLRVDKFIDKITL